MIWAVQSFDGPNRHAQSILIAQVRIERDGSYAIVLTNVTTFGVAIAIAIWVLYWRLKLKLNIDPDGTNISNKN